MFTSLGSWVAPQPGIGRNIYKPLISCSGLAPTSGGMPRVLVDTFHELTIPYLMFLSDNVRGQVCQGA